MACEQPITLHEDNDETLLITIDRQAGGDDLTTVTLLELYLKTDRCTDDAAVTTLLLTSADITEIDILTQTAAQITAHAFIPAAALDEPYERWWRIDGLNAGGQRRTAMYGAVTVVDL